MSDVQIKNENLENRKDSVTSVNDQEISSDSSSNRDYTLTSSDIDLEAKKGDVIKVKASKDADTTLKFIEEHANSFEEPTPEEEKKLSTKVQWIIVPLTAAISLCLYADKAVFSYSPMLNLWNDVKGMNQDTYNNCNSLYYVGYIVGQVNLYFLIKYPLRLVFTAVCAAWTVIMFCHCLQYSYKGSYALRLFLGYVESIAVTLLNKTMSQFLTSKEKASVAPLFVISTYIVTIPVGFIAYGVLKIVNPAIAQWRIFSIIIAGITAVLTVVIFWIYPSNPTDARFLSLKEKVWVIKRVQKSTRQSIENNVLKKYQIKECIKDPITWLFFFYMFFIMLANNLAYQSNLLFVSVGAVSNLDSTVISAVGGGYAAVCCLLAYVTLKWTNSISWTTILWTLPSFAASVAMITLPWEKHYALIAMILVPCFGINWILCITWSTQTCGGETKQIFRMGLVQGLAYSVANIISPQLWRANDGPRYYPAWIVQLVLSFTATPIIAFVIRVILKRRNEQRLLNMEVNSAKFGFVEKEDGTKEKVDVAALDLTDLENETFIYPL